MYIWASLSVLTALSDSSRCGQVSVLSVHVVGSTTRVVTQPDSKVLHLQRSFLVNLQQNHKQRVNECHTLIYCPTSQVVTELWWRTRPQYTVSPEAFFIFLSCETKYQKRDLATTWLGAKILIRYRGGVGFLAEGSRRPMTLYSRSCNKET